MTDAHGPSRWWQRWLTPPARAPRTAPPAPGATASLARAETQGERPARRRTATSPHESQAFMDTDFAWAYRLDDTQDAPVRPVKAPHPVK